MPAISDFTITRSGDDYLVRLVTNEGGVFEASATFEQLDLISEEIDRQLDSDEEEMADSSPSA